jgi:hypothetical protein|tara:strand:- start:782 stop:1231 length:450 start_codon:yes stop_codon:yes gene_type:complete
MLRETEDDLKHEGTLAKAMASLLFCTASKAHAKYRIDGWFHQGNELKGFFECKWYTDNKKAFAMLNIPKFKELIDLSEITKKSSFLLVREKLKKDVGGRWGYIELHNGKEVCCKYECKIAGGTPPGRKPLPDDVEPLIVFDYKEINWVN